MTDAVRQTGQWALAVTFLRGIGPKVQGAVQGALRREALRHERAMKLGIRSGAPGGKTFQELSELTLITRKAQGFSGTKPLIRNNDLVRSIKTVGPIAGGAFFVGVQRSATNRNGASLADVAATHEFGRTMVVSVDKPGKGGKTVRDFFWALLRKGLISKPLKKATKILVITIPPRPFIRPIFESLRAGQRDRIGNDVAGALGLKT